jgi:mannose-6-phosphate isomerase-like protein (cupin superfamily)
VSGLLHRFADAPVVREPDNDLVLRALLGAADSDADLSMTWVQLSGHHRRLRTEASTRIYVVLEGGGTITVDDEPHTVRSGDTVVIPRGTSYDLDGPMTYLVLNQPGFRDGDDHYLDDHDESVPVQEG